MEYEKRFIRIMEGISTPAQKPRLTQNTMQNVKVVLRFISTIEHTKKRDAAFTTSLQSIV